MGLGGWGGGDPQGQPRPAVVAPLPQPQPQQWRHAGHPWNERGSKNQIINL